MLPPRAVADNVNDAQWSPSGKYLLYHQSRPITGPDIQLALTGGKMLPTLTKPGIWSLATKKSVTFTEFLASGQYFYDYTWIAKQDIAARIETVFNSQNQSKIARIHWIAPETGLTRSYNCAADVEEIQFVAGNPTRPQVVITGHLKGAIAASPITTIGADPGAGYVAIIANLDGTSRQIELPASDAFLKFTADGSDLVASVFRYDQAVKKQFEAVYKLNQSTWKFELINGKVLAPERVIEPVTPNLKTKLVDAPKQPGQVIGKRSAVLISSTSDEPKQAVIASDASSVELSATEKTIALITKGVLQVREIVPIDIEAYKKAKEAAVKAKAISDAKQSALALLMFAADHDDTYPSNAAGWQDRVSPYGRVAGILDNFVYTFGGGHMKEIEHLSDQEIGYVEGPGGRAVAYGDGHVKWIPYSAIPALSKERRQRE
jgi:hypothetical protein